MALWVYDARSHRYRLTADGAQQFGRRPGTFVGERQLIGLRDAWIAHAKDNTNALAGQLARGEISVQQWTLAMRQEIRTNFINEYVLAHGGRNTMTPADWGRIGQQVQVQYRYLDGFAADIAAGRYSEAQIAARARMYVESSSQAFEQARQLARGAPNLPAYPGDGSTQCLSNCKCWWQIRETEAEWLCTWRLSPVENCPDCLERSRTWAPLIFAKTAVRSLADVHAALEAVANG